MARKGRLKVGAKRKYHYNKTPKVADKETCKLQCTKVEVNDQCGSKSVTVHLESVAVQSEPMELESVAVQSEPMELESVAVQSEPLELNDQCAQTLTVETNNVLTQTFEQDSDHTYAKCPEEGSEFVCEQVSYECNMPDKDESCVDFVEVQEDIDIEIQYESVTIQSYSFSSFAKDIRDCGRLRHYSIRETEYDITLIKFYGGDYMAVMYTIKFDSDFKCSVRVHRKEIDQSHALWQDMPSQFTTLDCAVRLLDRFETLTVCCGNPEEMYHNLVPIGSALTSNTDSEILAYREGDFGAKFGSDERYTSTIRSSKCELLTLRKVKCISCTNYGYALKKRQKRVEVRGANGKKFINSSFKHKDMTRNELCKKLFEQKEKIGNLQQTVFKLKRQYDAAIRVNGVNVKEYEHKELQGLMASCSADFQRSFPDSNCRQRLFWEQQAKYSSKEDKRGMRWHPMIIRWCLFMRHKSEKAYEAIKESGFINLPSTRTLYDYSHFLKSELGFQKDVFQLAASEAEKHKLYSEEWRRNVGLLFDEIKIREDLVYDKHTGELVGYCNLGAIGNQMMEFESMGSGQELAKSILVVMMRSVCSKLCFPLCVFATKSISSDYLYPIIWQTVGFVQTQLKLTVLFLTCDGATPNRRFFNMNRVGNEDVVYRSKNPHKRNKYIYFISDPPHLLKTLRNNLSNSYSHNKTRHLWLNGKDISWLHIVKLFEEQCELNVFNPCPKLTRKHVHLASFNYMKVNLAAQVISESVANAIEELYGPDTSETVRFLKLFNKMFDCMNVRSVMEGRNKRNCNLEPYKSVNDQRLHFLQNDVTNYLSDWEHQVQNRPGEFTITQRSSMLLSYQTILGVKMTVNSVSACVRSLLDEGASFVLSHCFNQDPLEQHLGHYRSKCGANNNPSVNEVRNIITTIRAVNSQAIAPKRGNTMACDENDFNYIDNSKVPKRKSVRL